MQAGTHSRRQYLLYGKKMDETSYSIAIHHAQVCHLSNPLQVAEGIADDIQMFVLLIGLPPHLQPVILCTKQYTLGQTQKQVTCKCTNGQ